MLYIFSSWFLVMKQYQNPKISNKNRIERKYRTEFGPTCTVNSDLRKRSERSRKSSELGKDAATTALQVLCFGLRPGRTGSNA